MGKAAAKQARTLELEFTLAPRPTNHEGKGRGQQRRAGARNRDREEVNVVAPAELSGPQFVGAAATVAADIRNPLEFPSLSAEQAGTTSTQGRPNGSDSLAQKLAKGSRFTIRNANGIEEDEEFPSLVADNQPMSRAGPIPGSKPESGKTSKGATGGSKRSVHVRVSKSDASQEETDAGVRLGSMSPNVSIQVTHKNPPTFAQGVGPPLPRVTRVSSTQNIKVQPSRGLRLDSDFPSLVPTSAPPSTQPSVPPGWGVKKEPAKPSKNGVKSTPPVKDLHQSSAEEYPSLVPSSAKGPLDATVKGLSKIKTTTIVNGIKTGPSAVNGTRSTNVQPAVESWSEPSKARNKKKKSPSKPGSGEDDALTFASEAERKVSEMQIGELKKLSSNMGGTRLDLTSVANAAETKVMNSKVGLIKQPVDTGFGESSGVKPKTKAKPVPLNSQSDFPALGPTAAPVPSIFERKHHPTPPARPPGIAVEKVIPTNVTFTSSSGKSFPLPIETPSVSNRSYTQPPDFSRRNQQLSSDIADLLCNQQTKIKQFGKISAQFRYEGLDAPKYYRVSRDNQK